MDRDTRISVSISADLRLVLNPNAVLSLTQILCSLLLICDLLIFEPVFCAVAQIVLELA